MGRHAASVHQCISTPTNSPLVSSSYPAPLVLRLACISSHLRLIPFTSPIQWSLVVHPLAHSLELALAMSDTLFGESPPAQSTPRRNKQSASLFDDDAHRPSSSLFADESTQSHDSPWSFPTPKREARSSLIKKLLPSVQVPELYVDIYNTLLQQHGHAVRASSAKELLAESGLDSATSDKIYATVVQHEAQELERGEMNVLLALIGLAQEGEDVTLDSVDERKKSTATSFICFICYLCSNPLLTCTSPSASPAWTLYSTLSTLSTALSPRA